MLLEPFLYTIIRLVVEIAIGNNSLNKNTSGNYNLAIGQNTLKENTTGTGNTALGFA